MPQPVPKSRRPGSQRPDPLQITAAVFGVYAGFLGMEHGFFETLQGNRPTAGLRILASNREFPFPFGHEPAMTLIPNFMATGIAAMLTGLLIVIWSTAFVHKKHGAAVLLLLSAALFFVGGGFGPVTLLIVACIAAFRIDTPANPAPAPSRLRSAMAHGWLWFLIASVAWVPLEFAAGQVLHLANDRRRVLTNLNLLLSYPMLALFVLTLIAAAARSRSDADARFS